LDKAILKLLNDEYEGWEKLDLSISAKKAFMTMYLDSNLDSTPGDANCAYYEGWLDALDTFEVWIQELKEYSKEYWREKDD